MVPGGNPAGDRAILRTAIAPQVSVSPLNRVNLTSKPAPSVPSADQLTQVQALFVQHANAIRGFVLGLWPDADRANDIVQEVFLTVSAKANDFQIGTNFRAWAFSVAKNKVRQTMQKAADWRVQPLSGEVIDALTADEVDAFDHHDERLQALNDCIQRLAPQARRTVELRYREGQSPPAIAGLMHWTTNAVKVALSRAKDFLRGCVHKRLVGMEG
jgi:RNA polymerase sigma-70 factor, ECF subfamily